MRNILIAIFALVVVCSMANAQLASATVSDLYSVTVTGTLAVSVGTPGLMDALEPGYTYTCNPDPNGTFGGSGANITPQISGAEAGTPMQFEVDSDWGTHVQITFELPKTLLGEATGGDLRCSFGPQSLFQESNGALLNPNVPNVFTMNNAGAELFDLGMTVDVPANAAIDQYDGVVSLTAALTGL